jgi:hypothetical protein
VFKLVKFLLGVAMLGGFIWFGATVPLGKHTMFGHVRRIWHAEETQDAVQGTKEAAAPVVDKVKDAVREVREPN